LFWWIASKGGFLGTLEPEEIKIMVSSFFLSLKSLEKLLGFVWWELIML
jgi:hypothetical protein